MFEVRWTGKYPCLCSGEWIIKKNGEDVSHAIPQDLRHEEMNTYRIYSAWYFISDWEEVWEDYEAGLKLPEWLEENPWVSNICDTDEEKAELFEKIAICDWRHRSCGGCI